ncbi:MAG: hypothetical protein WC147_04095 [Syntrophomonas sp.]
MAKNQKQRPVDDRGIYKDGAQKNQDDKNELIFTNEKKKKRK